MTMRTRKRKQDARTLYFVDFLADLRAEMATWDDEDYSMQALVCKACDAPLIDPEQCWACEVTQ